MNQHLLITTIGDYELANVNNNIYNDEIETEIEKQAVVNILQHFLK